MLADRGVLFAPDYVINAGGIITVTLEYLARSSGEHCDVADVHAKLEEIPGRLQAIWEAAQRQGRTPDEVADSMARELIGR